MASYLRLWCHATWNDTEMICQAQPSFLRTNGLWSDPLYLQSSQSSTCILLLAVILLIIATTSYLLRPIGLPILSKMFGGLFVIGVLCSKNTLDFQALVPPTVYYVINTFSHLGFVFWSFILGVETNIGPLLKKINKEIIIISFSGLVLSLVFSYAGLKFLNISEESSDGLTKMILLNAQTFFMVTCNHVNEVGISNSDLGRLACAASLVLDIFGVFLTNMVYTIIYPLLAGDYWHPFVVTVTYIVMFVVCRPLMIHIISYTPEGGSVKHTHFLAIVIIVLTLAFLSYQVHHPLAIFLFGFLLPQEPLASILSDKLDAITSCVLFPVFCAMHGFEADFNCLNSKSIIVEILVIIGSVGKFLGTLVSAMFYGLHVRTALALSIIMASRGLLDIVVLGHFRQHGEISRENYIIGSLHILFCTGAFLPLVRYIYEPSTQYSTIIRQGVSTSSVTGTLQILLCIYKEENLAGLVHLLQAFHPTDEKPIPVIALQLVPLTAGRVSLPNLAPLEEVQSSAAYRSNMSRCNRIVKAFNSLERMTHGGTCPQHYVSLSSYEAMHNDICNLAHNKNISLLILPFHAQWNNKVGEFQGSSQSIRDVNKMVVEKAPCSLGLLIDRGPQILSELSNVYRVTVFFIGGVDDHEALAYTTIFVNNPSIKLTVVRLKSRKHNHHIQDFQRRYKDNEDNTIFQEFQRRCKDNDRVIFEEAIVKDGADTTKVVVNIKNEIDLAVVGRYHEPECIPLFGLYQDPWFAYPELGIFGDMLVAPEFGFSVLVVQERPHRIRNYYDEDDESLRF